MNEPNYYRIKFTGLPYDVWEYGQTAIEAIANARTDLDATGNATARPAVYGEWDCSPEHFTNGGEHSHHLTR